METTIQKLPQLVQKSSTYKLVVPENVEGKIRYLIRKYPHTEWSGILFYTYTGDFEHGNLLITCQDIYPMDLGTAGFTQFKMTSDVSNYIANNIELFDCEMGLVHSHHTLGAFFSGTDLGTLQSEGNDTNCFVSLIVDTQGTYKAAITRKKTTHKKVTIKDLGSSYDFFGEGARHEKATGNTTQEVDTTVIEYYMLDVDRHEVDNPFEFLDTRFEQIENNKKNTVNTLVQPAVRDYDQLAHPWASRLPKAVEKDLFDNGDAWTPDAALIHEAVCHMVTCSFILNVAKFDLKQWIVRHMENIYGEIFTDALMLQDWYNFIIPFVTNYFEDPSAPMNGLSYERYHKLVVQAMIKELRQYTQYSAYIQDYIDELEASK